MQPLLCGMNSIPYVAGYDPAVKFLPEETRQLVEEGRDPQWVREAIGSLDTEKASHAELSALLTRLQGAPQRPDFAFVEPSDLAGIRAERNSGSKTYAIPYDDAELLNRMTGAWLGRCCGCALGKPVEGYMGDHEGISSKDRIKRYLQEIAAHEYPLHDYFPGSSPAVEKVGPLWCPDSQREKIKFMETDDDIRYTVLGQMVLLKKGRDFTTLDVMRAWLEELPYGLVCTAETQAYRNFILRYSRFEKAEIDWFWVATHQNPCREWIGAQIRADSWGYAAPGNPELAADFAWRDARMSHVKNGIYGEMFVAAMIAAGFALTDPLEVVQAGLAEIPQKSRLYTEMQQVIEICREYQFKAEAFEDVLDEIYALLGHYHPVHTNNNAGLVVAALLLGKDDFERVITIAVMGGWDSDCNGATAGSIFGAMYGAEKIPAKWTNPLHDTLYSRIFGYHPIAISECARRSTEIAAQFR